MAAHLRWRDQVQSEETQGEFDCDLGIWRKNIWPLNYAPRICDSINTSLSKTNKQDTSLQRLSSGFCWRGTLEQGPAQTGVVPSSSHRCRQSSPCVSSQRPGEPLHEDPVVTLHVEAGQLLLQPTPTVCHSRAAAAPTLLSCLGQPPCYDAGPGRSLANSCVSAKHSDPQ